MGPRNSSLARANGVDLAAILAAKPLDVPVEKSHLHHRGHQNLIEMGRSKIDVPFLGQHSLGQTVWQYSPADADTRRKRFENVPA